MELPCLPVLLDDLRRGDDKHREPLVVVVLRYRQNLPGLAGAGAVGENEAALVVERRNSPGDALYLIVTQRPAELCRARCEVNFREEVRPCREDRPGR